MKSVTIGTIIVENVFTIHYQIRVIFDKSRCFEDTREHLINNQLPF